MALKEILDLLTAADAEGLTRLRAAGRRPKPPKRG